MAELTIILCDLLPNLERAWRRAFASYPEVEVQQGDLLEVEADAYVSPANSFGVMDGGIDAALSRRFPHIETRVQAAIAERGRLLPVGHALVVETGDADVPYLICAPTMELPSRVGHTSNAYRAMSALLSAAERFKPTTTQPSLRLPFRACVRALATWSRKWPRSRWRRHMRNGAGSRPDTTLSAICKSAVFAPTHISAS